ncbi:MAG: tetratricopeptide repeat protein [Chlorobi bacterium]|nr:tetratricopeptide repeat protein [Chlorobiota bacterium]
MKMNRLVILLTCSLVLFVRDSLVAWSQPGDEDRRYRMAQNYEREGDLASAARIYLELLEIDPDSRSYFDGLKRTWLQLGKFTELEPIVARHLEQYIDDVELLILYAELLHRAGKTKLAETKWREALDAGSRDVGTYILVGESYSKLRLFSRAAETYETARKRFGRNMVVVDRLARLYAILGEYKKSANDYVDLLGDQPGRLSYVQSGLSLITGTPAGIEAAIEVTAHLAKVRKGRPEYLELLAWLYTEKGDDSSAFQTVVQLDKSRKSRGSDLYGYADRMLRQAKYDVAISAYEYFLDEFDRNHALTPSVIYNYVYALQQRYNEQGSLTKETAHNLIKQYQEVLQYGKRHTIGDQAILAIAELQADVLNDPKEALKTLQGSQIDRRSPIAVETLLMKASITLRLGKLDEARRLYRDVTLHPVTSTDAEKYRELARLRYAETLLFTGDYTEGVDSLTTLTQDVGSDAVNDALDWLVLLQEHLEVNDSALHHFVQGRYGQRRRDWDKVITEMQVAYQVSPGSGLADDALYSKAEGLRQQGKFAEAIETALVLVEQYPEGTHADQALFFAARVAEDDLVQKEKAIELYTKILIDYPRSQRLGEARDRIRSLRGEGS